MGKISQHESQVQVILSVHLLKLETVEQGGLRIEEATGESLGGVALALQKRCREEVSQGRAAVSSMESQRKWGHRHRVRGFALDKLPLPAALLVASLMGALQVQEEAHI